MNLLAGNDWFHIDALALIVITLVAFIGACVARFAHRYLAGDTRRSAFYVELALMICAVAVMASANQLVLMFVAWAAANLLLVRLMMHKRAWRAADNAGRLALRHFMVGFAAIGAAFALLYASAGTATISDIVSGSTGSAWVTMALLLMLATAMSQSGAWPFHRWLTSSLNSPTPVSAIMHAGLVNGGGILVARFAPLYFDAPWLLTLMFVAGIASALIGTAWKLMQHDVKRMLACSTMSQMGFMLAQCGLGLFPAAIAHLCWHGLFKANLFLGTGAAAQEPRRVDIGTPGAARFALALACGLAGAAAFALVSGKPLLPGDTQLVLVVIAAIAGTQLALALIRGTSAGQCLAGLVATSAAGGLYGASVGAIGWLIAPLSIAQPQPLNAVHVAGLALLVAAWLAMLFGRGALKRLPPDRLRAAYVALLNGSQPHPDTVTTHRNDYRYL